MSSSYLESQRAAFKGALNSAASKISNKKSITSPSPSIGSTASRDKEAATTAASGAVTPAEGTTKRKRNDTTVYSQPENTGFGDQIGTQMHFALSYLREKNGAKTLDDVLGHLSLVKQPDEYKETVAEMLRRHPRVDFIPQPDLTEQTWRVGRYAYRPVIAGVKDKTSLIAYLQARKDASGVAVKDLKDGWPDCEPALASLEKAHKILVIRTKKEGNPKHVYLDDASLSVAIDDEFKNMWLRVPIPKSEDLPRKLTAVGQKPTSEDPTGGVSTVVKPKQQKKRATKKSGNVTNKHMEGVLKDFSHLKR
ncbi:related to transcription initiation factor IIE, beta subunit [Cephalotrichum gorgonifer]|uniref:Transcription initiation factor IIE subunit beta n=1 Tax=Cephalotrichum gorgonifer TaxID=2041049 RepID=A0AAE8N4Z1_9PEZI|nr:related to transcription initiation factor IIE, beta subunit [Cephalotrichum gorgonifer]